MEGVQGMSNHRKIRCNLALFDDLRVVVRSGLRGPRSYTIASEKQNPTTREWNLSGDFYMTIAGIELDAAVAHALRLASILVAKRKRS